MSIEFSKVTYIAAHTCLYPMRASNRSSSSSIVAIGLNLEGSSSLGLLESGFMAAPFSLSELLFGSGLPIMKKDE